MGPAEIVLVVSSPVPAKNRTLGDFATSEFFGMWRDRTDIIDSVQFARQLRSDGWKRSALMVLVDTDVLVDCLQGTEAARQWLEHTPRELLSIPGVVAMELVIGCRNRTEFRAFRSFSAPISSSGRRPPSSRARTSYSRNIDSRPDSEFLIASSAQWRWFAHLRL